jgi:hypothetical protein
LTEVTETVGIRLGKFLASQGISYGQFEKKTGWSNGLAGKVINKGVSFGVDKLERIFLAFPQLNPTWLITGGEEMIIKPADQGRNGTTTFVKPTDGTTSPLPQANALKEFSLAEDELNKITSTLNPVELVASLERLFVIIENNTNLPDADKQSIIAPLNELRNRLFLSVNQAIAAEAKYWAAMDAIKLLASQLKTEAGHNDK